MDLPHAAVQQRPGQLRTDRLIQMPMATVSPAQAGPSVLAVAQVSVRSSGLNASLARDCDDKKRVHDARVAQPSAQLSAARQHGTESGVELCISEISSGTFSEGRQALRQAAPSTELPILDS